MPWSGQLHYLVVGEKGEDATLQTQTFPEHDEEPFLNYITIYIKLFCIHREAKKQDMYAFRNMANLLPRDHEWSHQTSLHAVILVHVSGDQSSL